jgi:hypothetical protein
MKRAAGVGQVRYYWSGTPTFTCQDLAGSEQAWNTNL